MNQTYYEIVSTRIVALRPNQRQLLMDDWPRDEYGERKVLAGYVDWTDAELTNIMDRIDAMAVDWAPENERISLYETLLRIPKDQRDEIMWSCSYPGRNRRLSMALSKAEVEILWDVIHQSVPNLDEVLCEYAREAHGDEASHLKALKETAEQLDTDTPLGVTAVLMPRYAPVFQTERSEREFNERGTRV